MIGCGYGLATPLGAPAWPFLGTGCWEDPVERVTGWAVALKAALGTKGLADSFLSFIPSPTRYPPPPAGSVLRVDSVVD